LLNTLFKELFESIDNIIRTSWSWNKRKNL